MRPGQEQCQPSVRDHDHLAIVSTDCGSESCGADLAFFKSNYVVITDIKTETALNKCNTSLLHRMSSRTTALSS
ncbi:hypothetical protein TNCV_2058261 [Trichonephila clavipes]|nr:hypothetical protein TNCV_2058261 [Trichonephila clavipes]